MYIGIGSNIDPEKNLHVCAGLLRKKWNDIVFSRVLKTAARDFEDQEDFLNAVARFETTMEPMEVLRSVQEIETALKKAPPFRFGPRTIDVDLLLYDDESVNLPDLQVAHPRMHERRFVLEPLSELIDPAKKHPVLGETWETLLAKTQDQECETTEMRL